VKLPREIVARRFSSLVLASAMWIRNGGSFRIAPVIGIEEEASFMRGTCGMVRRVYHPIRMQEERRISACVIAENLAKADARSRKQPME